MTLDFLRVPPEFVPPRCRTCEYVNVTERLPLRRISDGRIIAGVCCGLAIHLDRPVRQMRIIMLATTLVGGIGPLLYAFWWATMPVGDPYEEAGQARPPELERLVSPPRRAVSARVPVPAIILGGAMLSAALLMILQRVGFGLDLTVILPVLFILAGIGLVWTQLDADSSLRKVTIIRIAGGAGLAALGVIALLSRRGTIGDLWWALAAAMAIIIVVAIVLAPWVLKVIRELNSEREARVREATRADIAAHLHDSVLQSLAMIRSHADNPSEVARIARHQERELREWLYVDRNAPGTSFISDAKTVVAQVEDDFGVPIDAVFVGDTAPTPRLESLLAATREALVNAVRHGRPPVSLYIEVGEKTVDVYVRDQGDGFDLAAIPTDRFGVRESIIGRTQRRGGTATVDVRPGRGTEIRLSLPLADPDGATTTYGRAGKEKR
jgi:signal transduction histidine kinase/phage shock protein PspC (stress-responsive transcriptional regulator)